jgi:hypothetical protein
MVRRYVEGKLSFEDDGLANRTLQLPHIAGPAIGTQLPDSIVEEATDRVAILLTMD